MLKEFCDQKKYMLIAAAIGVIAVFLPWATVKSGMLNFSANGLDGDGVITLILFSIVGYLIFRNDKTEELSGNNLYLVVGGFGICALIGIYDWSNASNSFPAVSNQLVSVNIGIGLYLTALSGIAGAVIPFVLKNKENN
jgi:hypothetical protein